MNGYDLVAPGDTLSAAHVNLLMSSGLPRVTSSTRPTSPEHGQFIYELDTDRILQFNSTIDDWIDWRWISAGLPYDTNAIIGTKPDPIGPVPPVRFEFSDTVTVTNGAGGFDLLYSTRGITFPNCILWMSWNVGDWVSYCSQVVPILDNCSLTNFNAIAMKPDGSVVANGDFFRLNLRVIGC